MAHSSFSVFISYDFLYMFYTLPLENVAFITQRTVLLYPLPMYCSVKPSTCKHVFNCVSVSLRPFLFHLTLNFSLPPQIRCALPCLWTQRALLGFLMPSLGALKSVCLWIHPETTLSSFLHYLTVVIYYYFLFLYSSQGLALCPASNSHLLWTVANICWTFTM